MNKQEGNTIIKLIINENVSGAFEFTKAKVIFSGRDNKNIIELDYILLQEEYFQCVDDKDVLYDKLLTVVNKIYTEHIKLKMLGYSYPIYKLLFDTKGNITCSLSEISQSGKKLDKLDIKSFVKEIKLNPYTNYKLREINIRAEVDIVSIGTDSKTKINGLEHLIKITDNNLSLLEHNLSKYYSGELRLKNPKVIRMGIMFYNIEHLIIEDNSRLLGLNSQVLVHMINLKRITLPLKIKDSWVNNMKTSELVKIHKLENEDAYIMEYYNLDNIESLKIDFK